MNDANEVQMSTDDAVRVLRILTQVCVSIDRIGSSSEEAGDVATALADYFSGGDVFRALSRARHLMSVTLDATMAADDVDARLGELAYWPLKPGES